jgi:heterodisulfide reductase subunit A
VTTVEGRTGAFRSTIHDGAGEMVLEHGAVIVATGAEGAVPSEYLYGEDERVVTRTDLEKRIAEGEDFGGRTIVMIQCVGSRDEERPYCSRVCCRGSMENALRIKKKSPDAQVFVIYRDIMTYGLNEALYDEARDMGVIFVRYDLEEKPGVRAEGDGLKVNVRDPILDRTISIDTDLLVLSRAIIPQEGNRELAGILDAPLNRDGFFLEAHSRLRPVDLKTPGMFLCGLAHSPRTVSESLVQARAAAGRALTILSKEELRPEGSTARVKTRNCAGCRLCIDACPYGAIDFDEDEKVAVVSEIMCQGCGVCSAVCPGGVSQQSDFTTKQMLAMIDAGLEGGR